MNKAHERLRQLEETARRGRTLGCDNWRKYGSGTCPHKLDIIRPGAFMLTIFLFIIAPFGTLAAVGYHNVTTTSILNGGINCRPNGYCDVGQPQGAYWLGYIGCASVFSLFVFWITFVFFAKYLPHRKYTNAIKEYTQLQQMME